MTTWITPKTNWQRGDYFNLEPDYARIKNNILYVYEKTLQLYPSYQLKTMKEYTIYDIPHADFFNTVEENIELLVQGHFRPSGFREGKRYSGNDAPWDHEDLNRIEENLALLKQIYDSAENGKRELPFILGEEIQI
jgi:hypothetical protein